MKDKEYDFEYQGKRYIAVDDNSGECHRCCFHASVPCFDRPRCTSKSRKDKRNVVFMLVEE